MYKISLDRLTPLKTVFPLARFGVRRSDQIKKISKCQIYFSQPGKQKRSQSGITWPPKGQSDNPSNFSPAIYVSTYHTDVIEGVSKKGRNSNEIEIICKLLY